MNQSMNLAFSKKEADLRKQWLKTYNEEEILDFNCEETKVTDMINKELPVVRESTKHFYNLLRRIT